jgi:diadenosine tetraphosphate (Ap4A) HIT family hydrolase
VNGCEACDLAEGRHPLPGGLIFGTAHWRVEHCVGPLGLGALIVKPLRHVTAVAELSDDEAAELGPLLRTASRVAARLGDADQVYNCLWSHSGGRPVHIHYVIQPVSQSQMADFGAFGPALQLAMFDRGDAPTGADIERVATAARETFHELDGVHPQPD